MNQCVAVIVVYSILVACTSNVSVASENQASVSKVPNTISSYLSEFLKLDEDVKNSTYDKSRNYFSNQSRADVYRSTLSVKPMFSKTLQSSLFGEVEQERTSVNAKWEQFLPTGSSFFIETDQFFEDPKNDIGGLTSAWRFNFEQAIWNNAFGSASRRLLDSVEASNKSFAAKEQIAIMDSCIDGIEKYLNVYSNQALYEISQKQLQLSKKVMRISRNGYRRSLLRKIDYLSAQAEYAKMKSENIDNKNKLEKFINTYVTQIYKSSNLKVSEEANGKSLTDFVNVEKPDGFFKQLPHVLLYEPKKVLQYIDAMADMNAKRNQYKSNKSDNKTPVALGVQGVQRKLIGATGNSGGVFNEIRNRSFEVYLKLDLPIINRQRSGDIESSYYSWKQSEIMSKKVENDLGEKFRELKISRANIEENIEWNNKSLDYSQLQLNEANRLLNAGKIEFNDYNTYQNNHFSNLRQKIQLQLDLWNVRFQQAQFSDQLVNYCKGAS